MTAKEKIIDFFKDSPGKYFELWVNDKKIASNAKDADPNETETLGKIEKSFEYAMPGNKLTLKVSNNNNMNGSVEFTIYNTDSGQRESGISKADTTGMPNFEKGYQMGYEAGKRDEKQEALLKRLEALENGEGQKSGFDIASLTEKLAGSEQGQLILMAIMKKLGMME